MKLYYIANIRILTDRAHSIQVMKMCEAFASQNIEVELVVPDRRSAVGESRAFEYYGVKPIFKIRKIPNPDLLGSTTRLSKLFYWLDFIVFFTKLFVLKIDKDAIIYCREPILTVPFLKKVTKKYIEIHDLRVGQPFFYKLLKKANGVIVITKYLKDSLVKNGVSAEKIMVASDAVDIEKFDIERTKSEARRMLNLNPSDVLVVYAGSLQKWKGTETLLKAQELIHGAKILIVTGKPYSEIPLYLKAADILVLPNSAEEKISRFYTSPMKLFEYMASGRPIVASDLPSIREILDENTARFFIPDNHQSLAENIQYFLTHPDEADKIAAVAYERSKEYTWDNRAKKIIESV